MLFFHSEKKCKCTVNPLKENYCMTIMNVCLQMSIKYSK